MLYISLYIKKESIKVKKKQMKYKIMKLKNDILIYIPYKVKMKVISAELKNNKLKLNYNEKKSYTIEDLEDFYIKLLNNNLEKYIVELNKNQEIVKNYKINFHKIK